MILKKKEKEKDPSLTLRCPPTYESSTFVLTLRPHGQHLEIYKYQTPSKWVSIDRCCFFAPDIRFKDH